MQNTHMCTLAAALVLSACGGASLTMPGGTTEMASGLPHCDLPVGTVALTQEEDADKAERAKYDLPSPLPLLEVMIHQSNCFQLVARGSIIDAIKAEQVLGGQSQLVAADYYIKPKITFFSHTEPGGAVTSGATAGSGLLGGILPSQITPWLGTVGQSLKFGEAKTILSLIDTRTGIVSAAAEGNVSQADLDTSKVVADALGSGMGGYERTDEGRIVAAAFVNAYQKLVDKARYTASMKR